MAGRQGPTGSRWGLRDAAMLAPAVAVGIATYLAYLHTHPYPAYGAGLYLDIAEQIRLAGYGYPERIPHYSEGGVPFAYPPLLFAVAAVVRDATGVGPIAYARYLPGAVTVLSLVPYYAVARELLDTRRRAGVATVLFAATPAILQWHLSGGGIVRAPAFLLTLTGIYTGIRLFETGKRRWLAASTVLFALVLLSHPTYAAFVGLTYLMLFAAFDRSVRGFVRGAIVAIGGLALISPWLWLVARTHGLSVFTAASGTHGGIGGGAADVLASVGWPPTASTDDALAGLVLVAGGYLVGRRRLFLPVWTVGSAVVLADVRFLFVGGTMAAVAVAFDAVLVPAGRHLRSLGGRRVATTAVSVLAVVLVLTAGVSGVLYGSSNLDTHAGDRSQPQFVDDAALDAMAWAETNTDPEAEFVVVGDAAEWFPYFADRTILVGPWGVEWKSAARYRQQLSRYRAVSTCDTASCVTRELRQGGHRPEYLYVPRGEYTVRGLQHRTGSSLPQSLAASERYERQYANEGVVVYRVNRSTAGADRPELRDGAPTTARSPRAQPSRGGHARARL